MFYAWDITIPAGTSEADPVVQTLKLTKGVITRVDVKFPPGCHGVVKVRLLRSEFQLVPLSSGEWVTGDGEIVQTEPYYELVEVPAELKFIGCSPAATYPHTVTVRVSIVPEEIGDPLQVLRGFVDVLKRLIGIP
jgi:hypothetical protein